MTLCGSLAIVILPLLRVPLGLDVTQFGSWAGASVHDVAAVATAQRVPRALTIAVVVKLTRVVLLAPLVPGRVAGPPQAALRRRQDRPHVPLFVAGFLVSVAPREHRRAPHPVLSAASTAQSVLLVAALFGLGTGIHVPSLVRTGAGRWHSA